MGGTRSAKRFQVDAGISLFDRADASGLASELTLLVILER